MKATVLALGCRVNQSESAVIEGSLNENGLSIVNLNENPDVCIINTCTVTVKSDYQSRQLIRKAARSGAKVIVTGCYSSLRADEVKKMSGSIELVDNSGKYEIVSRLTGSGSDLVYSDVKRSRPHLKVQDGCNFRCAYCSVPLARGRSRSVPLEEALMRAQAIEAAGYNEIVLTGIHLGSYGQDFTERSNLKELIRLIIKHTDIKRIRLSSI